MWQLHDDAVRPFARIRITKANVGIFVAHATDQTCNSLNVLNAVNGEVFNLCAGRYLLSHLFATTNR
jgi:hypothetical protein